MAASSWSRTARTRSVTTMTRWLAGPHGDTGITRPRYALGLGRRTVPFERDATPRVLVPAGIAVIVTREFFAHLHDGEHAAHLERPEGPPPGIIRKVFFRKRIFILPH